MLPAVALWGALPGRSPRLGVAEATRLARVSVVMVIILLMVVSFALECAMGRDRGDDG